VDVGCKIALADPNQIAESNRGQFALVDLAPNRFLRDAEPLGDLGDAQNPLSRFGRRIGFLRRFFLALARATKVPRDASAAFPVPEPQTRGTLPGSRAGRSL
jgi:hypothetical protein